MELDAFEPARNDVVDVRTPALRHGESGAEGDEPVARDGGCPGVDLADLRGLGGDGEDDALVDAVRVHIAEQPCAGHIRAMMISPVRVFDECGARLGRELVIEDVSVKIYYHTTQFYSPLPKM